MRKIMFYINKISDGGAERVLVNLAMQFAAYGYETIVVTSFRTEGEYFFDSKIKRISLEDVQIIQSRLKRNISRICKLRKICKTEKPDILISFMAEPNFRAILATRGLSVKTIISVRNDPKQEYGGRLGKLIAKYLLPMADGCVFQTKDAKNWFSDKLQKKSKIIFNAVKPDFFEVKRNPEDKLIVSCGRLAEQKNQKLLIEAFSCLSNEHLDAKMYIYGEGPLEKQLEKFIIEKQLENRVFLKGSTMEVQKVLSKATVFALSSDYEGMPNALMEALVVGVPSISTDCPCGGPRMLIEHGVNGLLVPVNNVKEMTAALEKLLTNLEYAEKLGKEAKLRANEYRPEKNFVQWRGYIERILET